MKPILVTAATRRELSLLIEAIGGERQSLPGCGEFYDGYLGACRVVIAVTGLGKVNTAMGATALLARFAPSLLINTGCGGAYPGSGLAIGDLAVASSEICGEEGVETPDGWFPLELIGIPLCRSNGVRYFNELPLAPAPAQKAVALAASHGVILKQGAFVTVSTCSGTDARGKEFAGRFGALCENMEGAAAAQVALVHGVDCLEVRGISNFVENRDLSRWDIDRAVRNVQKLLLLILPNICN